MTYFGNLKINTNPCTEQDQRRNWDITNQLFQAIINQGTIDNYTVSVDIDDTEPTYLNDKLENQGAYLAGTHQPVYADISTDSGHRKVRLFTAAAAGAGTDDKTVFVSAADTTNAYLYDKFNAHTAFESGKDVVVSVDIASPGGNEKIRAFWDVSSITGYSTTVTRLLACVSGNTRFIDTTNFYSELFDNVTFVRITFADDVMTADKQYQLIRGTTTAAVSRTDTTFTVDAVVLLADSLDPRTVFGDPAEAVTIHKGNWVGALPDGSRVVAVYNDDDAQWEMLLAEDVGEDIRGVTAGIIGAATGTYSGGTLTPGTGLAYLYTMPSGPEGTAWTKELPAKIVENWARTEIQPLKAVHLRKSRLNDLGEQIYSIVSEGCTAVPFI